MTGVAFIMTLQFICFCLCGGGVKTAVESHAGCHESAPETREGFAASSMLSAQEGDCCPRIDSRVVVALNPQDSLSAAQSTVSQAAPFVIPASRISLMGSLSAAGDRISSPPRSLILRI